MGLTGNKSDKTIPKSETPGLRSRPFLITVIALLATLICSSLCVIALLATMPEKKISASQTNLATSTPLAQSTATHLSPAPSPTKSIASATPSLSPTQGLARGEYRIVAYDKSSTGGWRIIIYGVKASERERIVVNQDQAVGTSATATTIPRSIRIIDYEDDS